MVSVIVPVYNVVDYLPRCIESILRQTYSDLEIILVDDGSQDGSEVLCDRYAIEDSRIIVVHQRNSGVAVARNVGVEYATGDLIVFVDADDWIESESIKQRVAAIGTSDLLSAGYVKDYGSQGMCIEDDIPIGTYRGSNFADVLNRMIYCNDHKFNDTFSSIWNKVFRTHLLKRCCSSIDVCLHYEEDAALVYTYVLQCDSITIGENSGYHYCVRDTSAVHSNYEFFLRDVNDLYIYLRRIFGKAVWKNALLIPLQRWIAELTIYGVNEKLGFCDDVKIPMYVLPYRELIENRRVVLFGAGKIGRDYFIGMRNANRLPIHWVDNGSAGREIFGAIIEPTSILRSMDYDYILIAVKEYKMAENIKGELLEKGVSLDKILWQAPNLIF